MSERVQFAVGAQTYDALFGEIEFNELSKFCSEYSNRFLVSDSNVWALHGTKFGSLGDCYVVPAGEKSKSFESLLGLLSWLAASGCDRKSLLIAVGGGMIGDLTGFAAAAFMRGIAFANVATSLLAQVDAALGGKTGINLPEGKNLVGSFHHPVRVWCDPALLLTLPDREFRNGMAEVIKYGFAVQGSVLEQLDSGFTAINRREADALTKIAALCARAKASVVQEDPDETTGRRSVLNFGHTVGHAIEAELGFEELLHGEAVGLGMIIEAIIGERIGMTPQGTSERVKATISDWGLPTEMPAQLNDAALVEKMRRDKKSQSGELTFSLLESVGKCRLVKIVPEAVVVESLQAFRGSAQ